jgi:hypothetical protein
MSDRDLPARCVRYSDYGINADNLHYKRDLREDPDYLAEQLQEQQIEFKRIAVRHPEDTRRLGRGLGFDAQREKTKDSRTPWFVRTFGPWAWELDAMNMNELRQRVRRTIRAEIDLEKWEAYLVAEQAERESIADYVKGMAKLSRIPG